MKIGSLAPGWIEASLEDFCVIIQGQSPPGETYNTSGEGLPFFQGKAEFGELYPLPVKWCTAPAKIAEKDDILISIRAPVGPTNVCPFTACIGRGLAAIRPIGGVNCKYVLYGLRYTAQKLLDESTGSTFDAISGQTLRQHNLPVAPVAEQRRIVAEIEKQFTRLDAAAAALKRVRANLERYRASVLKAACEGRLVPTEGELARREGRSWEPASVLLDRIRAERKVQLQLNLNGIPQTSTTGPAHTPEGWLWASLGDVLHTIEAGRSFKCDEHPPNKNQLGVVKVSAVTWGDFDELESKTCTDSSKFAREYLIKKGDLLFSRANTIELVGACVIVGDFNLRLMLSDKILRFKVASSIPQEWVLHWLRSWFGRYEIERLSTGNQNSMRNIGHDRIKSIRLALPPLSEIHRITAELERRFSIVDGIQRQIDSDLKRAESLKQSTLMRAFEGKLVLQDPNDEPASILLEKISGTTNRGYPSPTQSPRSLRRRPRATKETANA